ncbi:zinc finger, CCHC-type containing protein [Tanacetum coccineum]
MGDENPIRTLGDYSKTSHDGYRNTIKLPVGNNVDLNQHLKDFLKLVDSLDLDGKNRERSCLHLFQFSLRNQASNWLEGLPAGSITTWEDLTTRFLAQFFPPGRTAKLHNDILIESVFGMTSNTMYQLPSEPSRQEEFEDLVMNFILNQEENVRQLEEYMCVIGSDFMQLSLEVVGKLRGEIRIEQNRIKKIKKITSSPQILLSFEVYTPPMTYPDEVEEIIGIPMEVEPLEETQLEDLGLNTCNHNIPLSFREIPSFDEPEPQPNPLPNCPSLDVSLGEERGPKPPIKPHSPDGFRMKEVDHLTNHTSPSPHVASFHPKDTYCYYHPCIGDPKKHYGFKPGLLGHSGSLGVDFLNMEMIGNEWELESKEVIFDEKKLGSS